MLQGHTSWKPRALSPIKLTTTPRSRWRDHQHAHMLLIDNPSHVILPDEVHGAGDSTTIVYWGYIEVILG